MRQLSISIAALSVALGLAGCNDGAGGPVASAPAPEAPTAMALPAGSACAKEIDRYQAIVKDDLGTGNVGQSVYDQIQTEMGRAAAACSAGKGGEAHSIVASSKARHGYRA